MSDFDPAVPLTMAKFKTVHGFNLNAGTKLVVTDTPTQRGEVTPAMARRLFNAGVAIPTDDFRPTPVESEDEAKAREAREALADALVETPGADGSTDVIDEDVVAPDDLLIWQEDDAETGKKAGQKVTNDDLRTIASREGAIVETDDNKPSLIRKIIENRASRPTE